MAVSDSDQSSGSRREVFTPITPPLSSASPSVHTASAAYQIDDDDHQSYHQQQMNQTSRHVQAEAQQPQNQKHDHNCPKHGNLLRCYSSSLLPLSCIRPLDGNGA